MNRPRSPPEGSPLSPEICRMLVEQSPTPSWHTGVDGTCIYFNPAWLDYTGRSSEQALEEGWQRGIHQEDRARCAELFQQRCEQLQPFEAVYRRLRHDG